MDSIRNDIGSVLIASLWMMSFFAVITANLGFQASQHLELMKRETQSLEIQMDFESVYTWVREALQNDPEPYHDSPDDAWFGMLKLPDPWSNRVKASVQDEESKLNLNSAQETMLEAFLDRFEEKFGRLKGNVKGFRREILKARAQKRFLSFEELYLLEDIEPEDLQRIKPFVTVYIETRRLNVNTADFILLQSLVDALTGGAVIKKDLLEKIERLRQQKKTLRTDDLEPEDLMRRLEIRPTIDMLHLVNQFLRYVTTDSQSFSLTMKHKRGAQAEVVFTDRGEAIEMEVLSWHEI